MGKKLIEIAVAALMLFGIFGLTACGGDKVNKIDIGGEIDVGKPMPTMAVRIMLDKDIFHRDDEIMIKPLKSNMLLIT